MVMRSEYKSINTIHHQIHTPGSVCKVRSCARCNWLIFFSAGANFAFWISKYILRNLSTVLREPYNILKLRYYNPKYNFSTNQQAFWNCSHEKNHKKCGYINVIYKTLSCHQAYFEPNTGTSYFSYIWVLFLYLLQIIQIYLKWLDTNETMPIHQLVGFERVSLRAKETLSWLITVRAENMAVWNESRGFYIEPGKQKKYMI